MGVASYLEDDLTRFLEATETLPMYCSPFSKRLLRELRG